MHIIFITVMRFSIEMMKGNGAVACRNRSYLWKDDWTIV